MNDIKSWKKIAAFAYESYKDFGDGAVLIKEQTGKPFSADDMELRYICFDPDNSELPTDALEMINDYKPEKEVVIIIENTQGQKLSLHLTAEKIGATPLEAYKELHGSLVKGHVYQLKMDLGVAQPGYYIYEREDGAMFVFCRLGMDDDAGDICRTEEIVRVHRDFRDLFVVTDMAVC